MLDKILAIDYGTKRIGLAVNQDFLAEPLKIITYEQEADAIDEIATYCNHNQIAQIVLGLSEAESAEKTKIFEEKLQAQLDPQIPIHFYDETLSSAEVIKRLKERNKPLPKEIDHFAAALILEEWLIAHSNQMTS